MAGSGAKASSLSQRRSVHAGLLLFVSFVWALMWANLDVLVVVRAFPPPLNAASNTAFYWVATWDIIFPLLSLLAFREHAWVPIAGVIVGGWEDILFFWIQGKPVPALTPWLAPSSTAELLYLRAALFLILAALGEVASHSLPSELPGRRLLRYPRLLVVDAGLIAAASPFNLGFVVLFPVMLALAWGLERVPELLEIPEGAWPGYLRMQEPCDATSPPSHLVPAPAEPKLGVSARPLDKRGIELCEQFARRRSDHLGEPLFLLNQAGLAFSAGATIGASLLCRSALDSAAFMFYQRAASLEPSVGGLNTSELRKVPTLERTGHADMGEVRRAVRKAANLSPEQIEAWESVQTRGNFGAHTAEKLDEFYRNYREVESRALREKGVFTPSEHILVSDIRALEDIRATSEIIAILEGFLYGPPKPRRIER